MTERKSPRRARETTAPYAASTLSTRDLKEITRRIVHATHPKMIILFGSRAYGKPRPHSDVDLLVVSEQTGSQSERTEPIRKLFSGAPYKLDIHARTPDELTQRLEMGDQFIQDIVERGRQLYPERTANGFVARAHTALLQGQTHPKENTVVVLEWVEKAEEDFEAAQTILRRRKKFLPNVLCWHSQQTVEKYLKAFLTRHRVRFEREHKLDELLDSCLTIDADFRFVKTEVDAVDICKPKIRYPGSSVTEEQARAAFSACKTIRKFVRAKLGLD